MDRTPLLSEEARRSLEERLRVLEDERIPRLEHELELSRDASSAAALRATRNEAVQVRVALSSASALEDSPHDPTKVELGDTVTVRREGSSVRERFTLVGELEARLDEGWISIESPLGSAVLGARVGEAMVVSTPGGPVTHEVLAIDRGT